MRPCCASLWIAARLPTDHGSGDTYQQTVECSEEHAAMVQTSAIQQVCNEIVREFQPDRIILFGSHAYGIPRDDSDVDLMVILPFEGNGLQKAAEIVRKVQPPFAIDLLARTPDEIRQRLAWNDYFLSEIMDKGKVLYAASNR